MNLWKKNIAQDQELETAKAELETIKLDFDSVKEELKTAQEEASHYQLEYTALNELFEELKAENETLKAENLTLASEGATLEVKAAEAAAEIVSEVLGEEAVAITDDSEQLSLLDRFATLKGAEKQEFYNANKHEIFTALKR